MDYNEDYGNEYDEDYGDDTTPQASSLVHTAAKPSPKRTYATPIPALSAQYADDYTDDEEEDVGKLPPVKQQLPSSLQIAAPKVPQVQALSSQATAAPAQIRLASVQAVPDVSPKAKSEVDSHGDVSSSRRRRSSVGKILTDEEMKAERALARVRAREEAEAKAEAERQAKQTLDAVWRAQAEAEHRAMTDADWKARCEAKAKAKAEADAKAEAERRARWELDRLAAEAQAKADAEAKALWDAEEARQAEARARAKAEKQRESDEERRLRKEKEREDRDRRRAARERCEPPPKETEEERRIRKEREREQQRDAEEQKRLQKEKEAKEARLAELKALGEAKRREEAFWHSQFEAERIAKEEADIAAKQEADRLAKLEAERLAKLELKRLAELEADRVAQAKADAEAKERADARAKAKALRQAQLLAEAEAQAKAEAEAQAKIAEAKAKAIGERLRSEVARTEFKSPSLKVKMSLKALKGLDGYSRFSSLRAFSLYYNNILCSLPVWLTRKLLEQTSYTTSMSMKCLIVALAVIVTVCHARRDYQGLIPNGNNVQRNGRPWSGVGHTSAAGSGPRNAFGKDFMNAAFMWTAALCEADSDADGFSNGEELGDPQCVWTFESSRRERQISRTRGLLTRLLQR